MPLVITTAITKNNPLAWDAPSWLPLTKHFHSVSARALEILLLCALLLDNLDVVVGNRILSLRAPAAKITES